MAKHGERGIAGLWARGRRLYTRDIWEVDLGTPPRIRALAWLGLRVIAISVRAFVRERLQMRSMALTTITLFAIVPVLAVSFSLFKGFQGLRDLEKEVVPIVLSTVIGKSVHDVQVGTEEATALRARQEEIEGRLREYIERIQGGAIGGLGILFLLWSAISLLSNVEHAFNDIWGVKRERALLQKVVYYLFSVLVGPILLGFSVSVSAALENQTAVQWIVQWIPYGNHLLGLAMPIAASIVAFTLLYMLMPNTQVRVQPALIGACVAGLGFELAKYCYFDIMVGSFRKYDAVFSSLAAVPLFILWLYLIWLIILVGATVAFATQNARTYRSEDEALTASQAFRELLGLRIMTLLAARFGRGDPPAGAQEAAEELRVPVRLVREVLHDLGEGGLVLETAVPAAGYAPARPPAQITPREVVRSLRDRAGIVLHLPPDRVSTQLEDLVRKAEGVGGEAYAAVDFERIAGVEKKKS